MSHYHHGNLKESLIQAGDDELRNLGPGGLSLRAISRKLNVSHNAPYRHFTDKNALLGEILYRTLCELTDRLQEAELIYPHSLLHQIQYFGRAWALLSLKNPRKLEFLFGSLREALQTDRLKLQFEHMVTMLESLVGEVAARAIIGSFIGTSLTVATSSFAHRSDEEAYELFDHIAENLLNAPAL